MTDRQHKTTRRTALLALAGTAAVAALPIAAAAQIGATLDNAAWDRALASFRRVEAQHGAAWSAWEQANEAVDAATPDRIARYFDDYRLGIGMKRDDVEFWLRDYNRGRTEGRLDVTRTADEFDAYQRTIIEARERFQTERLWEQADAHLPAFREARDALMAVPAPTVAALLVKIEIATTSLDDDHAEATLADARRLLTKEA